MVATQAGGLHAAAAATPATELGMDLWLAARVGDLQRVRYLVEVKGHDVNGKSQGRDRNIAGRWSTNPSPLMAAC